MPPSSWAAARSAGSVRLTQTAVVYTPATSSGRYNVVANRALACRLVTTGNNTVSAFDRAELMAGRDFWFDPTYFLPENAQIKVDSVMWQVRAGTFQGLGDCDPPAAKRCMVVRQQ